MSQYKVVSRQFICPRCGKKIVSQFQFQIEPSDVCQQCYYQWYNQGKSTNILTCVKQKSKNILLG